MIRRYSYVDPVFRSNTRYQNLVATDSNSILIIYRLISGTLNCDDIYNNRRYKFKTNYCKFPYIENINNRPTMHRLLDNFPTEVKLIDLDTYFKRSRFNSEFYKSIQSELIKCLISNNEGRYLEAFFYLYRIIEGVSYSIPLIYLSKNRKYNSTYKQLQSFFGKKELDGELAFFKRFIKESFNREDFYNSTIDINLLEIEIEEIRGFYYKLYMQKLDSTSQKNQITDYTEDEEIKVTFIGFYDFLITIRNRFFHFTQGTWQQNLSSTELLFPDLFFKPIINHGINWISLILFEVIKVDFEKGTN